jgi:hypothetical protein
MGFRDCFILDISYKEIGPIYGMPYAGRPQYIAAQEQIMAYMKYPALDTLHGYGAVYVVCYRRNT